MNFKANNEKVKRKVDKVQSHSGNGAAAMLLHLDCQSPVFVHWCLLATNFFLLLAEKDM